MLVSRIGNGVAKHRDTNGGNESMRNHGGTEPSKTVVKGVTETLSKLTDLLSDEETATTRRDATTGQPIIPLQPAPTHETVESPENPESPEGVEPVEAAVVAVPDVEPSAAPEEETEPEILAAREGPVPGPATIPPTAQWKAGHGPRLFSAALLLLAVAGTSALGLRYAENRGSTEFLSVVAGIAVVVGLWALLIASTPQVVSLRGSVLTVRNSSGSERFDLADGLQPVDVLGQPRSSGWALLLHRANNTSVVLRRRDVDAVALDPIVRHYRALAEQRYADRQARFGR